MQNDLTDEKLAHKLMHLLDPQTNKKAREKLRRVAHLLDEAGASERAAELILQFVDHTR